MKTHPLRNFGGLPTLGVIEKIDPGAIWSVDVALNASRAEFPHSLAADLTLVSPNLGVAVAGCYQPADQQSPGV